MVTYIFISVWFQNTYILHYCHLAFQITTISLLKHKGHWKVISVVQDIFLDSHIINRLQKATLCSIQ